MEAKLIVLKLFLDKLGIPHDIDTFDDRKKVQKAVYLGQLTRVDLGYRFGWYLKGPYCPALTRDYYSLDEAVKSGDEEFRRYGLRKSLKEKLGRISPVLNVPGEIPLSQEDWLELISSFHFLRKIRKLDEKSADEVLWKEKPGLAKYRDTAEKKLSEVGLIP